MKEHLIKVGSRWLIEEVYETLTESDDPNDVAFAKTVFEEVKENYHFVSPIEPVFSLLTALNIKY